MVVDAQLLADKQFPGMLHPGNTRGEPPWLERIHIAPEDVFEHSNPALGSVAKR